jgi:hypothetical protein
MPTGFGKTGRIFCAVFLSVSIVNAQSRSENFTTDPCAPSASCPNAAATYAAPEPMSEHERQLREAPKSDKNDLLLALFIAAAIIAAILLADELTGKKWASPADLDAKGPGFPDAQALGRFQVQGYAEPGWPFAVDFEALPETTTWLEVRYKEGPKPGRQADIPLPYRPGRHIEVVRLPAWNRGLGVARYTLHSAIVREGERLVYQPLKVYGIGAGPKAVGSLYLFVRDIGPARGSDPNKVGYTIEATRPFSRTLIEVLKLPKPGKNKLIRMAAVSTPFTGRFSKGSWAGMPFQPRPGVGVYLLQARAWGTADGGKDWTGALAPNYVSIVP